MCKQVKLVPLVGKTLKEIEETASAEVSAGGTVVGMGTVQVALPPLPGELETKFSETPVLVIIRRGLNPPTMFDDDPDEDEAFGEN